MRACIALKIPQSNAYTVGGAVAAGVSWAAAGKVKVFGDAVVIGVIAVQQIGVVAVVGADNPLDIAVQVVS